MLDSLHIKNFRCFEDLTIPELGRVNLIVGKNNSGKSTLLEAVNILAHSMEHSYTATEVIQAIVETLSNRNELYLASHSGVRVEQFKTIFNRKKQSNNFIISQSANSTNHVEIQLLKQDRQIGFQYINSSRNHNEFYQIAEETNPIAIYFKSITDFYETKKLGFISCFFKLLKPESRKHAKSKVFFLSTKIHEDDDLTVIYDRILDEGFRNDLILALKLLDSQILDLYAKDRGDGKRIFMIQTTGGKPIPIKSMGEGMSRLLQIFLYAFQARGGFLLIDEFENGLHYSIQEEVWEKLFKLAKELDIQVFATTHSMDAIKAFCKVSLADQEVEGKLISLGHSAFGENKGKITAVVHNENDMQYILDTGMEVR